MIFGCARRGFSNSARAPAPISQTARRERKLSGGGKSSGLMSFLTLGDRAAGAIKSGGTTRRAAKMVVVDVDHPDIEAYIDWKVKEEQKVAALVTGSKIVKKHLKAILHACVNCEGPGDDASTRPEPGAEARAQARAPRHVPDGMIQRVIQFARQGYQRHRLRDLRHRLGFGSLSHRLRPELEQFGARHRRLPARGGGRRRLESHPPPDGKVAQDAEGARPLGQDRRCGLGLRRPRPPIHTTINDWHTCPAAGPITASTRAPNIFSSTIPPAISPRSTSCTSASRDGVRH